MRIRCESWQNKVGSIDLMGVSILSISRNIHCSKTQGNYSHHRGLSGFKVYGKCHLKPLIHGSKRLACVLPWPILLIFFVPDHRGLCCEACTKARNCKMWTHPGRFVISFPLLLPLNIPRDLLFSLLISWFLLLP